MNWTETVKEIAGLKLFLSRGGSGAPVLVLHHDIGTVESLPFYDNLAKEFDVLVPREDASKLLLYEVYQDDAAFASNVVFGERRVEDKVTQHVERNGNVLI